jgi:ABC-type molybdate transport system substrate-binding protein
MRFFISFTFLSCLSILGALCALPARAESLTVAVAANVQYAFDDLRTAFTQTVVRFLGQVDCANSERRAVRFIRVG